MDVKIIHAYLYGHLEQNVTMNQPIKSTMKKGKIIIFSVCIKLLYGHRSTRLHVKMFFIAAYPLGGFKNSKHDARLYLLRPSNVFEIIWMDWTTYIDSKRRDLI